MIQFACTIPGEPQPWQRTQGSGRRRFKNKRWAAYEKAAQLHLELALHRHGVGRRRGPLFPSGPVELEVDAFWPCKGKPRKRAPWPRRWKATRPDGDNVLKGVADASQGLLVADDGQYARLAVRCFYAAQGGAGARVEIRAASLPDWGTGGSLGTREAP